MEIVRIFQLDNTSDHSCCPPFPVQALGHLTKWEKTMTHDAAAFGNKIECSKKMRLHLVPLGGGFKDFLYSPLFGEDSHFD